MTQGLEKRKRVLVAMSGGVDSSVAASLLVDQGYEVIGVTMQVWDYTQCDITEGAGTCCSSLDVDDARSVADLLEIPFYVMNCEAKFREKVIDPFIASYQKGETPLPCVNCNTFLKFDHLIQKMKELECDYLATGHYAQIETGHDGKARLITSEDSWKDQTYFLFTLEPELLPKLIFPVGHMKKPEVRKYAEERGLVVARKKDSVGICFVGDQGYDNFLEKEVGAGAFKGGELCLYPTGEVLTHHQGIHHFTYGQRKRLGISSDRPLFVIRIDAESGRVWVGDEKYLFADRMEIESLHLLDSISPDEKLRVKIRYAHKGALATLNFKESGKMEVLFDEPQRAITPGQAAVIYREQQLIGGGWILKN